MRSIPLENEIELKYKVFTYGSADDKPRKIKNIIFLSIIFIKFYSNDQIQILGLGFHDLIRSHHHEIHEFFITTFLSIQENGCNTNNWNQFSPFWFVDKYRKFVFQPKTHFDINYLLMIIEKKTVFSRLNRISTRFFISWQFNDV